MLKYVGFPESPARPPAAAAAAAPDAFPAAAAAPDTTGASPNFLPEPSKLETSATAALMAFSSAFASAPWILAVSTPLLKTRKVGMAEMLYVAASARCSSVFIFVKVAAPGLLCFAERDS